MRCALRADAIEDVTLRSSSYELAEYIQRGGSMGRTGPDDVGRFAVHVSAMIRLALFHSGNRELLVSSLKAGRDDCTASEPFRAAEWYSEYVPILLTIGVGGTLTVCFTLLVRGHIHRCCASWPV